MYVKKIFRINNDRPTWLIFEVMIREFLQKIVVRLGSQVGTGRVSTA